MELLFDYTLRLLPGLVLIGLLVALIPKEFILFRVVVLIMGFILMRDAMTPVGLWEFGVTENTMWLRFIDNGFILLVLALTSLIAVWGIVKWLDVKLIWFKTTDKMRAILIAMFAAVIVVVPFMIPYFSTPIEDRGGTVHYTLWVMLLVFALCGNLLEEVLFRGMFQEHMHKFLKPLHAIVLSGLLFAVGHTFLAITVTDLGFLVLLFTLVEGLMCAFIYYRYGLLPATVTHGLSIFFLSVGWV